MKSHYTSYRLTIYTVVCLLSLLFICCKEEPISFGEGNIEVRIEKGEEWIHDFPLFLGIKLKNPPQIAIWTEDTEGNFLSTIFVTNRIANQSWRAAKGNNRKEALPHWSHSRDASSVTDGIAGATPKNSFDVSLSLPDKSDKFIIKIEINHSTDFNEFYTKDTPDSSPYYSGGKEGSGQPALIYAVEIDPSSDPKEFEAKLIGYSSPDGSNGNIYQSLSTVTTALKIVDSITIRIH